MRLALALCLLATPSLADLRTDLLDMGAPGEVCFHRAYSSDHLASHPKQVTYSIAVGPDVASWEDHQLGMKIMVSTRDNKVLVGRSNCDITGKGLDCKNFDGPGRFTVTRSGEKLKVKITQPFVFPGTIPVTIGTKAQDDSTFLLARGGWTECH